MWDIELPNLESTLALGRSLGRVVDAPVWVGLSGDLGAGKTSFSQGVGSGLGIEQPIVSPTFILMAEYSEGRLPLLHADVYRLHPGEAEAIGLEESIDIWQGLVLVEWAEKVQDLFQPDHLWVDLLHAENGRKARVRASGPIHQDVMLRWRTDFEK